MSVEPIREWHVVISGFLQRSGDINGTVQTWRELRRLSCDDIAVELRSWRCDFPDLAETISRLQPQGESPKICVYGYSWGGMSAVNFAGELGRRGLAVDHMVLCDAVYRHWYWLGQWRAFFSEIPIRIPDNVRKVTQFRQSKSLPRGHRLVAENPGKTDLGPVNWLDVEHCWMDDTRQWRDACLAAAKGV